jgi:hypothetical protein
MGQRVELHSEQTGRDEERFYVLIVAFLVNRMATRHKSNCLSRSKEIFSTNGTVALHVLFNAPMRTLEVHCHANITGLRLVYMFRIGEPCNGNSPSPNLLLGGIFHNLNNDKWILLTNRPINGTRL